MNKIPVTVIVPVRNEELNLPHCMAWLGDFSQVFVVDSSSTDLTAKIAHEAGAQVVNFEWNGRFPKKRNWALSNLPIENEWVLFLDADEYLSNEFLAELRECICDNSVNGYRIRYTVYFQGRELRYGDGMHKLSLFRKSAGQYQMIDEHHWSLLDMEVHEHPIIQGRISTLRTPITHNDFKDMSHYLARHAAYADWEANRYADLRKRCGELTVRQLTSWRLTVRQLASWRLALWPLIAPQLTLRQKLKYTLLRWCIAPPIYFLGCYVYKLGFMDGRHGLLYAWYKAIYFSLIQHKIRTHERGKPL